MNQESRKAGIRFTMDDAESAWDGRFNCGPGAICAVLGMTPNELKPLMWDDFESKGYTNPTLMFETLDRCKAIYRRSYRGDEPCQFPKLNLGLARIQFAGPWTKPGVPMRVRYRQTHWVGVRNDSSEIFDINAMCVGGWMSFNEWGSQLMPWLIRECYPKSDGQWWPTHAIEIEGENRQ